MTLQKIILAIFMLTCLDACGPMATFDKPQPAGADDLSKIPNRLQGNYLSDDGFSSLVINDKEIVRIYDYSVILHKSELEEDQILSGDTLVDLTNGSKTLVMIKGDSIKAKVYHVDTLFILGEDNVMRKMKGYYFLNTYYEKSGWEVKKLSLKKGLMEISSLSSTEDIDNLKRITEAVEDTISQLKFTPSRREFKEFISHGGFKERELFNRMNK